MLEVYRRSQKVREHRGTYYGTVCTGKGRELVEGTRSVKKYLATTMGRGLVTLQVGH
jgi:hypothetical protein